MTVAEKRRSAIATRGNTGVRGGEKRYLAYTRRAGGNDHVFRHRAPRFIAQVDPQKLRLIRDTERIVREKGARPGNFGITHVNDRESWTVVTEWMPSTGSQGWLNREEHGAGNRLCLSRLTRESNPRAPATEKIDATPQSGHELR